MCEEKRKSAKAPKKSDDGAIVQQAAAQLRDRPQGYIPLFDALKKRIAEARIKAALSVNQELILLYWDIGSSILASQREHGWGAQVIEQLSHDLSKAFPETRSFSVRNLRSMRAFAKGYPDSAIVKQVVSQIPWGHNLRLIQTVKEPEARLWYAQQTIEHGWSRAVLVHQIESNLYERQGKAVTNFDQALPTPQSDLARELIKDPYSNAVDEFLRHPDDQPPIGLILCKERNRVTVEFSLRGMIQPMGVSEYQLLPKNVRDALPTPEQLEAELEKADQEVNE